MTTLRVDISLTSFKTAGGRIGGIKGISPDSAPQTTARLALLADIADRCLLFDLVFCLFPHWGAWS